MKIDEFIEKVNEHDGTYAESGNYTVRITSGSDVLLFVIPIKATNWLDVQWRWCDYDEVLSKADREYLSALIEEFLYTPIKERFPQKRYRLRWFDDEDGTKNYLAVDDYCWCWSIASTEGIFTESQLEDLKQKKPKLAPAIDAMKEEVEEDINESCNN